MYAEPLIIDDPNDCFFYHFMDLPGVGEVGTQWDLRDSIDAYLGNFDFTGKRTLDVGTASGYLTFELEKRGADVVSFDMSDGAQWNIVPHISIQPILKEILHERSLRHQKLRNGYWFAHRTLQSRANVYYGDIYNLPDALGQFDVAVFGMILGHLRDPFQALYSVSRLVTNTIIVTNQTFKTEQPLAAFTPNRDNKIQSVWWQLSDGCIKTMLGVLGFEIKHIVTCNPICTVKGHEGRDLCTAFVFQRSAQFPR